MAKLTPSATVKLALSLVAQSLSPTNENVKQKDLCASINDLRQIARTSQDLLDDIYKKLRTLPSPVETDDMSWHGDAFVCRWCNASWSVDKRRGFTSMDYLKIAGHPVNDCLWRLVLDEDTIDKKPTV